MVIIRDIYHPKISGLSFNDNLETEVIIVEVINLFRVFASAVRRKASAKKMLIVFWLMISFMSMTMGLLVAFAGAAWNEFFDVRRYGYESEVGFALVMAILHTLAFVFYVVFLGFFVWFIGLLEDNSRSVTKKCESVTSVNA